MSKKELLSKIGLRQDGRRPNELRRIRCKLGVFTQPDGSAYIEQGLTKVLAAVYGPHQVISWFIKQAMSCWFLPVGCDIRKLFKSRKIS